MTRLPLRLRAVKVSQPMGEFYAVAIPAKFLRQVVFLDPTRISSVDRVSFLYRLLGNQREASIPRAKKIADYINTVESAFPNSIILAANYSDKGELQENTEQRWKIETDECGDYLVVPTDQRVASVIDGQHRLLGFDHCDERRRDMELLCAVYMDLPQAYQAYLFATINMNQRKVDKSLAYEQFGYNLDDENALGWAPDKLAVFFSRRLNLDPNSPLYQHIKIAPLEADLVFSQNSNAQWMVSTACVVEGILGLISSKPKADRDMLHTQGAQDRKRSSLVQDNSPLRDLYLKSEDDKLWSYILAFLNFVKDQLWSHASDRSFIRKTIGIQALFDVFRIVAQSKPEELLLSELERTFKSVSDVNFAADFFQASGKGRVRVKNTILRAAELIKVGDLPDTDRAGYVTVLQQRSSSFIEGNQGQTRTA